jgi:hypothetical protein
MPHPRPRGHRECRAPAGINENKGITKENVGMKDLFWGGLLIGIGLVSGASVFLGDLGWFNLFFDTLGVYWLGKGLLGLIKRKDGPSDDVPAGVPPDIAQAARQILAGMRESFGSPAALVPARTADFRHLDLHRYDNCQAALERRGFRCLGDYEHTAVNRSPTSLIAPSLLRAYASEDGAMVIAYFQVKPRLGRRLKSLAVGLANLRWIAAPRDFAANLKMRQCVDIETEFDDGSFLVTTNGDVAAALSQPDSVQTAFHPAGTSLPALLDAHRNRLARVLHAGKRKPVPVRTGDQMLHMQKRLAAQKLAFRESVHWVTREELRAMAGGNAETADAIHAEVQRQLAAEHGALPRGAVTSPSVL